MTLMNTTNSEIWTNGIITLKVTRYNSATIMITNKYGSSQALNAAEWERRRCTMLQAGYDVAE